MFRHVIVEEITDADAVEHGPQHQVVVCGAEWPRDGHFELLVAALEFPDDEFVDFTAFGKQLTKRRP